MKAVNLSCAGSNGNTGIQSCAWDPKNITGAILLPTGTAYDTAAVTTMYATLQAAAKADSPSDRIYPIGLFKSIEDKSTDVQIETDGYGGKSFVRDGDYDWMFEYKNGFCFYKALRTFHNKQQSFVVMFIDEVNNVLWGTTDSNGDLTGFSLELLIVPNIKINTGSNATKYYIEFGLSNPTELNDNSYIVQLAANQQLTKLTGLLDTTLTATSSIDSTSGDVTVTLTSACGAVDLAELYPTELADITPAPVFQVYNVTQSAAVAVLSVTVTGSNIVIETDPTDHAPADVCTIQFGEVSDMEAVSIFGYAESNVVSVTVV